MSIKLWDISTNEDLSSIIDIYFEKWKNWDGIKTNFYLNTNKFEFDLLEKTVYDIVMFHFKQLNINYDKNKYTIEFWCKKNNIINNKVNLQSFHFDKDEYKYINERKINSPFLSCITYLSDSLDGTFITNVSIDDYKYKKFDSQNNLNLVFPLKNTQITFDGSLRHSVVNIFGNNENTIKERYVLVINIFNNHVSDLVEYPSDCFSSDSESSIENEEYYMKSNNILSINLLPDIKKIENDELFTNEFYENIFYKNKYEKILCLKDILFNDLTMEEIYSDIKKNKIYNIYTLKRGILKDNKLNLDLNDVKNNNIKITNRFIQRFKKNYSFFNEGIYQWLIGEIDSFVQSNNYNNLINTIELENIETIFPFILTCFVKIKDDIVEYYNLTENIKITITNAYALKSIKSVDYSLDIESKDDILIVFLMLSKSCDYKGGEIYFNDSLCNKLTMGDLLVMNSRNKCDLYNVIDGNQYGFIFHLNLE